MDSHTNVVFLLFALFGGVLQLISTIIADGIIIENRTHTICFYIGLVFFTIATVTVLLMLFLKFSRDIAREKWLPELAGLYHKNLPSMNFNLNNRNHFYDSHVKEKHIQPESENSSRNANKESSVRMLADLVDLLEIKKLNMTEIQLLEKVNQIIVSNYDKSRFTGEDE